jgi:hypothetical protein
MIRLSVDLIYGFRRDLAACAVTEQRKSLTGAFRSRRVEQDELV